ncbi:uncharacterized protein TRAVEDRAFT_52913 [Trametes versicolor FP-101664 SS1]|uniref:uncharacterized protein n=1 Tax=Trametes versicolor (strain FP-101664) TaxID=717944 RepID=UPI0004621F26|nr:uncharacterized protein TRAVEDRAFT_52913 [Trametes versicolor FP-101664 SS1]EIW53790.1 hypothetical protein TRAVEDRAFT_52913 [Trametes versicolor FP-101664 SS1]
MLSFAPGFVLVFFGHSLDEKYSQLITFEEHGFSNERAVEDVHAFSGRVVIEASR